MCLVKNVIFLRNILACAPGTIDVEPMALRVLLIICKVSPMLLGLACLIASYIPSLSNPFATRRNLFN